MRSEKPTNDKIIEQAHISYASSGTYNMYVLIFVWFQYHSAFSVMPPQTKIFLLLKYRYFNFQREICGQLANKPHYNYFVTEHRVHTNFTIRVYVVAGNIPKVYVIWGSNLIWSQYFKKCKFSSYSFLCLSQECKILW